MVVMLNDRKPSWNTQMLLHAQRRISELKRTIYGRFLKNQKEKQAWHQACEDFFAFQPFWSVLWLRENQHEIVNIDGRWRALAILILEILPKGFRTGYLHDMLCFRLTQAVLPMNQKKRIQLALLNVIESRPSVGRFKYDYKLASHVCDDDFMCELQHLSKQVHDDWVRGRAKRMLEYISKHQPKHVINEMKYGKN